MSVRFVFIIAFGIISAMLISQCNTNVAPSQAEMKGGKNVTVAFGIRTNEQFNEIAREAYVKVSAADIDAITRPMEIADTMLYGVVDNIPLGAQRLFEIFVYDSLQHLQYYGSRSVDLEAGVLTRVAIHIGSVSGPVEIIGIISDTVVTGGYIDTSTAAGYIDTLTGDTVFTGGYIDTSAAAGYIDTLTGDTVFTGGYIDTSAAAGYIDTLTGDTVFTGGYIDTSAAAGYIDTLTGDTVFTGGYIDTTVTGGYVDTVITDW